MRRRFAISAFSWLASMLASVPCEAGFIGPGKYSGIAVFDRWDGCILNRGTYVMYVSEKVKEHLRPYTGRPVQIDAMDVYQPMNPGEALIREFEYLGPKESRQIRVDPVLSDGEYDFLCGYGGFTLGGNYPASNLSAFDVKNGKTTIVKIKGREPQCRASGDSTR